MVDDESDLSRNPLAYPGPKTERSVLLRPDGEPVLDAESLDRELAELGVASMSARTPVAAVGSNGTPDVIRKKLRDGGLTPIVPLICGFLTGVRISVSAHVSRPGFVPAAPARLPGEIAPVVVGWFDAEQLARLDATEPNYDRVRLPARDHELTLTGWPAPGAVDVYRSRWGVLAGLDGDATPQPLLSQLELSGLLAALGIEPWCSHSPEAAAAALARSPELRERARDEFRRLGLVRPG